jgi:hypothetical protein
MLSLQTLGDPLKSPTPPTPVDVIPPVNADPNIEPTKIDDVQPTPVVQEPIVDTPSVVDDITLSVDGDLVDASGAILHKKGTFAIDNDTVTINDRSMTAAVADKFNAMGFNIPVPEDDSEDSLLGIAQTMAMQLYEQSNTQRYTNNPLLFEIEQHLATYGSLEGFNSFKDWTKVNVPKEDENGRIAVIRQHMLELGQESDIVELSLQAIKDRNEVDKYYDTSLGKLKAKQTEKINITLQQQKQQQAAIEAANEKHWNEVKAVINRGKLGELSIPETDRNNFYRFISEDAGGGKTQAMTKYESLPKDQQLMLDYFIFSDFNIDKLVKLQVQQKQVDAIKARAASKTFTIKGTQVDKAQNKANNLSLSTLKNS